MNTMCIECSLSLYCINKIKVEVRCCRRCDDAFIMHVSAVGTRSWLHEGFRSLRYDSDEERRVLGRMYESAVACSDSGLKRYTVRDGDSRYNSTNVRTVTVIPKEYSSHMCQRCQDIVSTLSVPP